MASDAFMELSDPETWGESIDAQFEKRGYGAFEISQFQFKTEDKAEDDEDSDDSSGNHGGAGHHGGRSHHSSHGHGSHAKGSSSAKNKEHTIKSFTINKPIDKGSLDLFLVCMEHTRIAWAMIFMREVGDVSKHPWLTLEFRGLHVDSFDWNLSPGVAGDEAKSQETLTFTFETVLIKYSRQTTTGTHSAVKIKGWNTKTNTRQIDEIEHDDRQDDENSDRQED